MTRAMVFVSADLLTAFWSVLMNVGGLVDGICRPLRQLDKVQLNICTDFVGSLSPGRIALSRSHEKATPALKAPGQLH
jgi:hypothetical protein